MPFGTVRPCICQEVDAADSIPSVRPLRQPLPNDVP
jgi:hypothetical protein